MYIVVAGLFEIEDVGVNSNDSVEECRLFNLFGSILESRNLF